MYQLKNDMHKIIDPFVQREGLTAVQAYILFYVLNNDNTNIGSLSKDLGLNQGNVSTLCKNMEKSGLITRNRNKTDERVVSLSVTEFGKEKFNFLLCDSNKGKIDSIINDIPIEKLEIIVAGLSEFHKLLDSLSESFKNNNI